MRVWRQLHGAIRGPPPVALPVGFNHDARGLGPLVSEVQPAVVEARHQEGIGNGVRVHIFVDPGTAVAQRGSEIVEVVGIDEPQYGTAIAGPEPRLWPCGG